MKQVELSVELPVPPSRAFELLYSTDAFVKAFHQRTTQSEAGVSAWEQNRRAVTYSKRLNLPGVLLRLLGNLSSISITEEQRVTSSSPELITVESIPVSKGHERFKTLVTASLSSSDISRGGTQLSSVVQVESPSVLGLRGVIEGSMHNIAKESLAALHSFSLEYVSSVEHDSERLPKATPRSSARRAAAAAPADETPPPPARRQSLQRSSSLGKRQRRGEESEDTSAVPGGLDRSASGRIIRRMTKRT